MAFSYQKCLDAPTHQQRVLAAMRTEIEPQINNYYASRRASHTLVSDESGQPLASGDVHVSYFRGPAFTKSRRSSSRNSAASMPSI